MQSGDFFSGNTTTLREEVTGDVITGTLTITGQALPTQTTVSTGTVTVTTGKTSSADIEKLKQSLVVPSKTGTALTEDDVDNIDEAIQFIKDMFKN